MLCVAVFVDDPGRLDDCISALQLSDFRGIELHLLSPTELPEPDPSSWGGLGTVQVHSLAAELGPDADSLWRGDYWSRLLAYLHKHLKGRREYLLLPTSVSVPKHFLRQILSVKRKLGTQVLFPLSVRHPFSTAFLHAKHVPGLSVQAIDQWLGEYASGKIIDLPTLAGYVALVGAEVIEDPDLPSLLNDQMLENHLREKGHGIALTDRIFVDDSRLPECEPRQDLPATWMEVLIRQHPLTGMRHALTELSDRHQQPIHASVNRQPVRLHISHNWGGGLGRWVEDFADADTDVRNIVLRPVGDWNAFGFKLALFESPVSDIPLQEWTLNLPILSTLVTHVQYRSIINEIVHQWCPDTVIVSSLIGHSLDCLRTGLPTLYVWHDFYPVCPFITATFTEPCTQCSTGRLQQCWKENTSERFFLHEGPDHWTVVRDRFAVLLNEQPIIQVAPSASVINRVHALFPQMLSSIHLIEHGLSQDLLKSLEPVVERKICEAEDKLTVVVLGSLGEHKGGQLLKSVFEQIAERYHLVLLGCGSGNLDVRSSDSVTIVERYEREQLGTLLRQFSPDVGLLLSQVPETFSFTLSELWAAGIPVIATRIGAFADRVQPGENGLLIEPVGDALVQALDAIDLDRSVLEMMRLFLGGCTHKNSDAMLAEYKKLLPLIEPSKAAFPFTKPISIDKDFVDRGCFIVKRNHSYAYILKAFLRFSLEKVKVSRKVPAFIRLVLNRF